MNQHEWLRPRRPMLAVMRAATEHCVSVAECLETLVARDLLPAEAIDDPRRGFLEPQSVVELLEKERLDARIDELRAQGHVPFFSRESGSKISLSWARCGRQPFERSHALAFASSYGDMVNAELTASQCIGEALRAQALRPLYAAWSFIGDELVRCWRTEPPSRSQGSNGSPLAKLANRDLPLFEPVLSLGFIADRLYGTDTLLLLSPTLDVGGLEFPP